MADETSSADNVLVRFELDANAYEAMTDLIAGPIRTC